MRPQLLKVTSGPVHSFTVRQDLLPHIDKLHYHTEIELIQIIRGKGTQFIGDSIKRFEAGDIFLIGSGLAHNLKYDEPYVQESGKSLTESRVIQFHENFWGASFLNLPENKIIRDLLEQSKRGIQIQGIAKIKIASFLDKLVDAEGPERILLLLTILQTLAKAPQDVCLLSSIGFNNEVKDFENHRMSLIYEYTLANFKKKIQLEEIAKIAHISPHSFCRYFKSRTKKTYSQFLLEVKVGQACKLLMENDLSIKELCYESGFNNFASFHKYFKIITGLSPLSYKKEFNQRKPAA